MLWIAEVPQGGRQVRGPDEYAVDPLHRRNSLELIQRRPGLDLHNQTDLSVSAPQVILHAAILARAATGRDAPDPLGRIANRLNGTLSFFRRLNVRQQN